MENYLNCKMGEIHRYQKGKKNMKGVLSIYRPEKNC